MIKYIITAFFLLWIAGYAAASMVMAEILNPFQFFVDWTHMSVDVRGALVFGLLFWAIASLGLGKMLEDLTD